MAFRHSPPGTRYAARGTWYIFYVTLALLALATSTAQSQDDASSGKRTMSIVDLIDLPGISGLQISPDGSYILYTRSDAVWDRNKTVSHIWRLSADGSENIQMTNGEDGESGGIWSPDGSQIAFVTERDDDDHNQIWLLNNGGGEALRLSDHPTSVSSLSWSPDGSTIYFRARDEKTEEEKEREEIDDNVFRYDEDWRYTHIWSIDVETGERTRVTGGEFHVRGYNLSMDGGSIAYSRAISPLYDDSPAAEIWVMNLPDSTGGMQITDNAVLESGFQISPDGRRILMTGNTNDDLTDYYFNDRLFVSDIDGSNVRCVVCGGDYDVSSARWHRDGNDIFFLASVGVRRNLYRVAVGNEEVSEVTSGDHALYNWDYEPKADVHAFKFQSPSDPGEIRVSTPEQPTPTQITDLFAYVDEQFLLPEVSAVQWQGEDGVTVEGLVYYPIGYEEGTRYPLVVQTHGGPASADLFRFPRSSNYESVLTAMGYVVFKPNYRGSTGYGDAFLRDMVGNYFNQAHKDVMTGVDHLIEIGLVDGDRMAKMGWSAGGHMTNKIITYTDRFKAAASGAGAINWVSMYGQSDVRVYRTPWFGGDPWSEDSPIDQYMADSPLFDIHKVTTPTIVLVGENDNRVPMPQSVELYRALKSNGVPTHLYVAPKQGHGWRELQQRLFKANVELDWFERWVHEREYTWEKRAPESADD